MDSKAPTVGAQCEAGVGIDSKSSQWPLYGAFGLRIRSQIDLPELARAADGEGRGDDVVITLGATPATLAGAHPLAPAMQVAADDFLLGTPAARYRVSRGRKVTVDPAPGASARDIRLYLLGTAMGALVHQRSLLPLHANAVRAGDVAVAFAGASGAGKSTLAAHLQRLGREVLCDDLCVIRFDTIRRAWASPGLARIKLWGDALPALEVDDGALERVADDIDKFSLPLAARSGEDRPLTRLYVLRPEAAGRLRITPLIGAEAVNAVVSNVYRWPLAAAMGRAADRFADCVALLRGCAVFELASPWGFDALPATLAALERHLA